MSFTVSVPERDSLALPPLESCDDMGAIRFIFRAFGIFSVCVFKGHRKSLLSEPGKSCLEFMFSALHYCISQQTRKHWASVGVWLDTLALVSRPTANVGPM